MQRKLQRWQEAKCKSRLKAEAGQFRKVRKHLVVIQYGLRRMEKRGMGKEDEVLGLKEKVGVDQRLLGRVGDGLVLA